MTRRNKSIAVVLTLCVVVLIVDKLFLSSGPSPAGAAPVPAPAAEQGDAANRVIATENPVAAASPQDRFGRRLRHIAERDDWTSEVERDAFAVPVTWPVFGTPQPAGDKRPTTGLTAGEAFRFTHELSAVMAGANGGYALINGSTVLVGQTVDGFTLVAVSARSATLEQDGIRVELQVPAGR